VIRVLWAGRTIITAVPCRRQRTAVRAARHDNPKAATKPFG
jgi:hypothetical protein